MMEMEIEDLVADLRDESNARASGFWRLEANRLILRAFVPAPDLDARVARAFAEATRSVSIDRVDLGIVQAFDSGESAVSIATELAEGSGSGDWLRAFDAACSIAVPISDATGQVVAVLATALPTRPSDVNPVIARLRELGTLALEG